MLMTKCVGDHYKMLVTVLAISVTDISFSISVGHQHSKPSSKFYHQHPIIVINFKLTNIADTFYFNLIVRISYTIILFQIRLEVTQTKFGSDISFSMRTFWFDAQTSSVTGQNQTMKCDLRLDPIATISTTQPDDCSCHTKEECFDSGKTRKILILHYLYSILLI